MKILIRNFIIVVLIFLIISAVFSLSVQREAFFEKPEEISLTKLVQEIDAGQVVAMTTQGREVKITLKDDTKQVLLKEENTSLTETLRNFEISPEKLRTIDITEGRESGLALFMSNVLPILLPFLLIGLFIWFMLRQAQRGQAQAFSFGRTKARLFKADKKRVTFAEVGGLDEAKEELREVVEFLKNPKKFLNMGAKIPRGVLLMGPPGSGKTLIARAVAGEAKVPFFHIAGSEFIEMFVGVGSARVRDTFQMAKKQAPAILFIDELDAIGRHRGAGLGGGHDEREQTLNQILVEMDGFEKDTNVIVMSATNRPDILDPALLRPGRFDRHIVLDGPDIKAREIILEIHAKKKPLAKNVDLRRVAQRTVGFTGADLENLMNEAAILAARKNKASISQEDIIASIEKVLMGPERRSRVFTKYEKKITAYHEAGHALVAKFIPHSDPVHKVSIVARGRAGGYTLKLPDKDRYLRSRSEFHSDLAVLLGGYAAEKLIFNEITTGAADDLKKASELARRIITRYGMSETLGPVIFGKSEELVFLGKELHEDRNYSEKTASLIDKEVEKLIREALSQATKIIEKYKSKLNTVAQVLLERETLEREEFETLIKKGTLPAAGPSKRKKAVQPAQKSGKKEVLAPKPKPEPEPAG